MKYPETRKDIVKDVLHGVEVVDEYRWLEQLKEPEVREWDKKQNDFTEDHLSAIPEKEWLFENLEKFTKYDRKGSLRFCEKSSRVFQQQKKADEQKWVVFMAEDENSEFREIINPNKWDEDETLSYYKPSFDGKYLIFGKAAGGNEDPVIHVMDLNSGEILPDRVKGWKQTIESWLPDNSGFYYSAKPLRGEVPEGEEFYWPRVYLHNLGTDKSEDKLVWKDDEKKELWCWNHVTYDGKYEILGKGLFYSSKNWIKKIGEDNLHEINHEMDAEYDIDYYEDKLYILTNKDAPNRKVMVADVENPSQINWKEIIPEKEETIQSININDEKIYVSYLKNAYSQIQIYDLSGNFIQEINLPEIGSAYLYTTPYQKQIYIWFSSYITQGAWYEYDFKSNSLKLFWAPDRDLDSSDLMTKQIWYKSKDGTDVPMFVAHKKGLEMNGENPTILYGYGGFDVSETPDFSLVTYLLAKRGYVMVTANIRGGGEFGEKWHKGGMKENKQNVFDDFIGAAEFLIDNNYTSPDHLAIHGGSNGGLLVGATMVQRPELFKAVLCEVPLLDMIRYHHSSIANIWAEEYGSAEKEDEFKYILKYSPYHNIYEHKQYPATLVTTGINDARVDPMHARKFVAKLQSLSNQENPAMLLVEDSSGHGGGTTETIRNKQIASHMSFVMDKIK